MQVINYADLADSEISEIQALIPDQENLSDLMKWALSRRQDFLPTVIANVIVQDEFTHHVIVPSREGLVLVYDTT